MSCDYCEGSFDGHCAYCESAKAESDLDKKWKAKASYPIRDKLHQYLIDAPSMSINDMRHTCDDLRKLWGRNLSRDIGIRILMILQAWEKSLMGMDDEDEKAKSSRIAFGHFSHLIYLTSTGICEKNKRKAIPHELFL